MMPMSDLAKAALLLEVSRQPAKWRGQVEQLNVILWELVQKDMLFPFMLALREILIVPQELECKTFCIYQTKPGKELRFQFRDVTDADWQTEKMREYFCGYYSADFIFFSDENTEEYIVDTAKEQLIEAEEYLVSPMIQKDACSKFACLSRLIEDTTQNRQEDMMRDVNQ